MVKKASPPLTNTSVYITLPPQLHMHNCVAHCRWQVGALVCVRRQYIANTTTVAAEATHTAPFCNMKGKREERRGIGVAALAATIQAPPPN